MDRAARPLLAAAGVAALGLGLVTVTPLAPTPKSLAAPAVELTTADGGLVSLWASVLDQSLTNITHLGTEALNPPLPITQQILTNQVRFLQEFLHDPGSIFAILGQVWDNFKDAIAAPFTQPDLSHLDTMQALAYHTLSGLMSTLLPDNHELGQALLDFSTTSLSGFLLGAAGTVVSPVVELSSSLGSMFDAIGDGNWGGAFTDALELPAHVLDGFLNGTTIDLSPLLADLHLPVITIRSLDLEMPGLLSAGGSMFTSIEADVCGASLPIVGCVVPINLNGSDSGPLGSLMDIGHDIAEALGWDGVGNPIEALT